MPAVAAMTLTRIDERPDGRAGSRIICLETSGRAWMNFCSICVRLYSGTALIPGNCFENPSWHRTSQPARGRIKIAGQGW
jgi:hypothetical protein